MNSLRQSVIAATFALLPIAAYAQTAPALPTATNALEDAATTASAATSWGISIGAEMTAYNTPRAIIPTIGVMGCGDKWCEITTLENGSTIATIRQEIAYRAKCSSDGYSCMLILAGGGLSAIPSSVGLTPSSVTLGSLGGGFALVYDLGGIFKRLKGAGVKAKFSVREASVTSVGVKPQYQFELAYRFK
jgi:hypothetical protein